jgi:hypothetical protein
MRIILWQKLSCGTLLYPRDFFLSQNPWIFCYLGFDNLTHVICVASTCICVVVTHKHVTYQHAVILPRRGHHKGTIGESSGLAPSCDVWSSGGQEAARAAFGSLLCACIPVEVVTVQKSSWQWAVSPSHPERSPNT